MIPLTPLHNLLHKHKDDFFQVVPFSPEQQKLVGLDLTAANTTLTPAVFNQTGLFSAYIFNKLAEAGAAYGIGGYDELRAVYGRSELFGKAEQGEEPRRLHLGTDIWGPVGTPVFAFMGGMVHSFAFNDNYGDYGATLILSHQLESVSFYTLYGHISLDDIRKLTPGQYFTRGEEVAHFGNPEENGHWPPHLHFQVMADLEGKEGDYPGVCKVSERQHYLSNCPDPDLILNLNRYV